jgi:hypothetical protein
MRQRITIILTFIVIIGVLVILNSLSQIKEDEEQDFEIAPNRSTYHSGPTGTRALHDLLNESGHKVIRWRESAERLLGSSGQMVATFVVVGQTRVPFSEEDAQAVLGWVNNGGRLVIIDRHLNDELMPNFSEWTISATQFGFPSLDTNPADATQMTENVTALQPVQPTILTQNINGVMPSRFASRLKVARLPAPESTEPLPPVIVTPGEYSGVPIVHISDRNGALLVDFDYGLGNIMVLSDPYLVSNGGIRLNDNLQLAINMLAARGGLIAFDEYHQGRGISQNPFASYFAGTPVLAIAAQVLLLVLLILWTNARRFGRPLPLPAVDRRSSLEFVASMAELQERSRAFDLAIENIYTRTRRVLARHAGVNYNSPRSEIAERIASRSSIDKHRLETLMRQCEEVINGQSASWRKAVDLVRRLRAVERELGLGLRSRDARHAAG